MIKGKQRSSRFLSRSGAQLCGQIPQSTNLQEEEPCVKLQMYNFLFTWATFACSLPKQIPLLLKWSLCQGGHRRVASPRSALRLRPGILLWISAELSPTGPLQPNVWVCQMRFLLFECPGKIWGWCNLGGIPALQKSAFCRALAWVPGRSIGMALHMEHAWRHQVTLPRKKQSTPAVKRWGKVPLPTIRRKCCVMWAAVRNCSLCYHIIGNYMYCFFRGCQITLQAFTIPAAAHRVLLIKLPKSRLCQCCQSSAALCWLLHSLGQLSAVWAVALVFWFFSLWDVNEDILTRTRNPMLWGWRSQRSSGFIRLFLWEDIAFPRGPVCENRPRLLYSELSLYLGTGLWILKPSGESEAASCF